MSKKKQKPAAKASAKEGNKKPSGLNELFHKFSQNSAHVLGSAWSFAVALVIIAVWGITGPIFNYSDTWQLIINTGTTIVTFLMVFLIQNTQNRDARALHLKLDELIRCVEAGRNNLVDLEDLPDEELDRLAKEFKSLREKDKAKVCEQVTNGKS